jgi:hypothetical protein
MASSWLKWLHLGGFSTNYPLLLDQTTQIGSFEQEMSAKQFLVVNLRGDFDMVAAISKHLPNFPVGISFLPDRTSQISTPESVYFEKILVLWSV